MDNIWDTFEDLNWDEAVDIYQPPNDLPAEPLFVALMRESIYKIWPNDAVMADFVDDVVQPLSDLLGHESAKGGDFAQERASEGKDAARYSFDQSMRAHLINGLFPVLHVGKVLKKWAVPQFRFYDDEVRRLFIAGYILHDWLKLPAVETTLEKAGFSHTDSIGPAQIPLVERIFEQWCQQLGLTQFLAPIGGPQPFIHDLIYIACNTQKRWGTLGNISLLPNLKLNVNKRGLCEQLSRLADYLTYIARNPRDVATNRSIHDLISALSDQTAYFTYHHVADIRGVISNIIHQTTLKSLQNDERVPLLFAPSGVVYLSQKTPPPPANGETIAETVIERVQHLVARQLSQSLDGFKRDGKGMKFADYYWDFFDTPQLIKLGQQATFKVIHAGKKPSSGKRFAKMEAGHWLPHSDLDLPDDSRVDQLAEWCYLAEKLVSETYPHFDAATFLLDKMNLNQLEADFNAVPRDNRAGGVGYHWYFAAGHYLKGAGLGLDPAAWQERVAEFAEALSIALPKQEDADDNGEDAWADLRTYIQAVLTISENQKPSASRDSFKTELDRYHHAKRKGRGKTSTCAMCSAAFSVSKQQEAAVLFAPQVYSNKLSLHGSDAIRNICTICGLETMLRQLLMNRSSASGGNFEGRRIRYLYFYPTYFFTPETLAIFRRLYINLRRMSFVDLRRQLTTGEGLDSKLHLDPRTLQRLEPLLLDPEIEQNPNEDRYIRMHFSEQEAATFYFLGVPPPGRDAKDAEAWVHPALLALLLPLCLDVKVVASESSLPLLLEADDLPETVLLDGPHAFVNYLTQRQRQLEAHLVEQSRFNIDEILPTLQRLIIGYLIQIDANSGMGKTGFDYRWQDMPAVARNLASSPLYAFHYLKKWHRKQEADALPIGKATLYLTYAHILDERSKMMSHAQELTKLYRQFYRARRPTTNSILRPLSLGAKTILDADPRLFGDQESLQEVVYGELQRRITKLQQDGLAVYPKGSTRENREAAIKAFATYLVDDIYFGAFRGDSSALQGKQLNLLNSACEAIYRQADAKEWADRDAAEQHEAIPDSN